MTELENLLLLVGDALIYFAALGALLRARTRIGLGAFFCALGVMHFLETYLAGIFYVALPLGVVTSPGSRVLFTGKLMMLLLLYIREDAVVVRQPFYGLLFGNVLLFALALMMRQHTLAALLPGHGADFGFLNQIGALMVWGTAVLFFDCIVMILLYERSRDWFGDRVFPRLWLVGALVLSLDQAAFFIGLHALTGAGLAVLTGGWVAKMGAVTLYSGLTTLYLRYFERPRGRKGDRPRIWDVFDTLTYRERYEDLLARVGCDALTGTLDRHSLEANGRRAVEIMAAARVSDYTYRFGGEEFVIIADGCRAEDALALGERIRRSAATAFAAGGEQVRLTVSIGIATCPRDAKDYDVLFEIADKRLYQAKAEGRDRVVAGIMRLVQAG